jgi:hypothetical protein
MIESNPGLPIIYPASFQCLLVELVNLFTVLGRKRNVQIRTLRVFFRADPEFGCVRVRPKADSRARNFHLLGDAEGCESGGVEGDGNFPFGREDVEGYVVKHVVGIWGWFELITLNVVRTG